MALHVFEFAYGRFRYEGVIVKETPKSYVLRSSGGSEYRRLKTRSMSVKETDDPKAVKQAFDEAWEAHEVPVRELKDALIARRTQQRADAFEAAGITDPYARNTETA